MQRTSKRAACAAVAATALAGGIIVTGGVAQALPGDPVVGPAVIAPTSGDETTTFTLTPNPVPANCEGDTSTDGYTWSTFVAPAATDPGTLTYNSQGPTNGGAFPLFRPTGQPVAAQPTAASTGQIVGQGEYSFGVFAGSGVLPDGDYNVGYACTLGGVTQSYWASPISITNPGGVINYGPQVVAAPDAPTNVAVTPGNGQLQVSFTPAGAAADSFEVTADDGAGGVFTATGASSPITVTGLTNFTTYDVTVTATNGGGTSPASSPAVPGTPEVTETVANLRATPGQESVLVEFDGVAGATGYLLETSAAGVGPFNLGPTETSFDVTGLTAGELVTFTVTPVLPAPRVAGPATVQAAANPNAVLYQTITVERPEGALILTQVCGEYGSLPGAPIVNAFPGYPEGEAALPAESNPSAPVLTRGGSDADPEFGDYPQPSPASYPTYCDLDLGTASLVTDGPLAGQYYQASGRMNQVTVLDTRDDDAGWTVTGTQQDLVNGTEVLDGNYVGWIPKVTSTSGGQVVTAGPRVLPGDGIASGTGLADGQTLASANAGEGLGIAELDARIQVLIPVALDSGVYEGDLTLTII